MTEVGSRSLLPAEQVAAIDEARAQNLSEIMQRTAMAIKAQRLQDHTTISALQTTLAEKEVELSRVRNEAVALRMENEQAMRTLRGDLAYSRSEADELRKKLSSANDHFENFYEHASLLWNTIEQRHRDFVSVDERADAFFLQQDASKALNRPSPASPTQRVDEFRTLLERFQTESLVPTASARY
jgi:chromosome segregation ATPase